MPETETIEFVQIATAKDNLYGMTRAGAVWKYNVDRQLWEPVSMAFSPTAERRGFKPDNRLADRRA
jgi:hypothetical protein